MYDDLNLTVHTGFCLPKTCSVNDVTEIMSGMLSQADMNVTAVNCQHHNSIPFRTQYIAVTIFSLLLGLVIFGTCYEIYMNHTERELLVKVKLGIPSLISESPCMTLIAFSAYTNGKNLFKISRSDAANAIACLSGLRGISLLWIILGHRFFDMFTLPSTNSIPATEKWLQSYWSLFHTMFHLAVDNFFLMGGLLVTWTFLKAFDR